MPTMQKDPVCGMTVSGTSALNSDFKGAHYVFCCSHCKVKFDQNPEQYLNGKVEGGTGGCGCGCGPSQ